MIRRQLPLGAHYTTGAYVRAFGEKSLVGQQEQPIAAETYHRIDQLGFLASVRARNRVPLLSLEAKGPGRTLINTRARVSFSRR